MTYYHNLPKLTMKEEYDLLVDYKTNNSTVAKNSLVLNTLRIMMKFINKFPFKLKEDLISECCLAICYALDKIVPVDSCKFSCYAYSFAKRAIIDYINTYNASSSEHNNILDMDEFISSQPEEDLDLNNLLDKLPKDDRQVIDDLYFKGLTTQECAIKYNYPHRNYITTIKSRILATLQELSA